MRLSSAGWSNEQNVGRCVEVAAGAQLIDQGTVDPTAASTSKSARVTGVGRQANRNRREVYEVLYSLRPDQGPFAESSHRAETAT
jgi:hypothetical protein